MSSDPAIRCLGLGKAYQLYARKSDQVKQLFFGSFHRYYLEYWVLRGIDLELQRGESVGIIGRNGAGKTTLLRLLCGITQPTCGEISVAGRIAPILALHRVNFLLRENEAAGGVQPRWCTCHLGLRELPLCNED